ncbi:ion channel DMI1 [Thermodesulfobacteriota bacterium]
MIRKANSKFKFYLERMLLQGAAYQLLFIAFLIVLVSVVAGAIGFLFVADFKGIDQAVWWAFLRLSDPGYLGDDKGLLLGTVSTIVTVLGYVLFMGAMIAILSQWLQSTMRNLQSGLTPISQKNHVLILGWTNRTPTIVNELVLSEGRLRRFLRRIGASKLRIVILAEEVSPELVQELREELGPHWSEKQVIFRSGTPLRMEHLKRVDFMNASVIILPGADFSEDGSEVLDTRTIKSLLSISNYENPVGDNHFPPVVAEMFDARKLPIARSAYKGEIALISSDTVISSLIAQNVRHRGLSYIYSELLTHGEGNAIYIRDFPQFDGENIHSLSRAFSGAIVLGVLRKQEGKIIPILNPPEGFSIELEDLLVLMARTYKEAEPLPTFERVSVSRSLPNKDHGNEGERRLLIMGWNNKIPALLKEFDSYESERFHIDILSLIPIAEREAYLSRFDLPLKNVELRHLHGDYTALHELQKVNPGSYSNILLVCNGWLESNEESDARTILGYLLLRQILIQSSSKSDILVELMDPENEKLFQKRTGEVMISPLILSHIVAHVSLRRELNVVFEELFTVGGAEIYFRPPSDYHVEGDTLTFDEISIKVLAQGDIALGLLKRNNQGSMKERMFLNPPKDSVWPIKDIEECIVLTTYN